MDDRSIDKAPSASLDMMALNKAVVNARSIVRKSKTHLINKLVRNVTGLKKKQGSEQQKEKNLKKAQRFLEEIDSMRTLKDDKIFKYALANMSKFDDIAKSTISPSARAMARLADHRLVKEYVQKFRDEQSDWRDLAAFMLMKQTGRKFKSSKQKDKAKGKKKQKDVEKVNKAENIKASKLMTEVYTHGLFRDDEFQKAKETLESDNKGELNFLQKRRLRIAKEMKEKKSNSSEKKKADMSIDSKVKQNTPDDDSKEDSEGDDSESEESNDESEGESNESEEDVSEKSGITKSKNLNNSRVSIPNPKEIDTSDEDEEDDDDDDDEEEAMDTEEQVNDTEDKEEDDDVEVPETHKVMKNKEKKKVEPLETKKSNEKDQKMVPLKSSVNSKKDKVEPLMSKKNSAKDTVVPLGSIKVSKQKNKESVVKQLNIGSVSDESEEEEDNDDIKPLMSKKSRAKDTVVPLGSEKRKVSSKNKECVVKQLNIGSVSDESDEEEDSDDGEAESTDEEEKPKQSRRMKGSKPVPKFLCEEGPNPKKLPKDSFFEGGEFDSDSEDSDKEKSEENDKDSSGDESQEIVGNRGKIKSLIYNGAGRGRGRGRGRGGGNNDSSFKFGGKDKAGKKSFGRGGRGGGRGRGGDGPFSFGNKDVMYKRRNQTIITEEGKTKIVTEPPKESKPKLHPSWEASRKRKAEESGGIKAFEGKKISFGDD